MDHARARWSDPDTSREAAAAADYTLTANQQRVEDYARQRGAAGFTDLQMHEDLEDRTSDLRSRRSELTARRIILDSGERRTHGDSPRRRTVWVHRAYLDSPPPVIDAPVSASQRKVLIGRAHEQAARLQQLAAGFRRQGLGNAAALVDEGAELLRQLAR